jgi:hypothetical protein
MLKKYIKWGVWRVVVCPSYCGDSVPTTSSQQIYISINLTSATNVNSYKLDLCSPYSDTKTIHCKYQLQIFPLLCFRDFRVS